MVNTLLSDDLKFWFIVSLVSFVISILIIVIMVKVLTKKFEEIAPIKENKK